MAKFYINSNKGFIKETTKDMYPIDFIDVCTSLVSTGWKISKVYGKEWVKLINKNPLIDDVTIWVEAF